MCNIIHLEKNDQKTYLTIVKLLINHVIHILYRYQCIIITKNKN